MSDILDDIPLNQIQQMWFQYDDMHFSIVISEHLYVTFGRGEPVSWPADRLI